MVTREVAAHGGREDYSARSGRQRASKAAWRLKPSHIGLRPSGWLTRNGWVARSRAMDIKLDVLLALPHEERVVLLRSLLAGDEVGRSVVIDAMLLRRSRRSGPAEQEL